MPRKESPTGLLGRVGTLAGLAALIGACGSVGDPRPPLANLPQPVGDLAVRQIGDEIEISWTRPIRTTEGTVARETDFAVWAVDVGEIDTPLASATIDEYRRQVQVRERALHGSSDAGDRIVLRSPLGDWQLGQAAILAVTALNRAGRHAGYSNQVGIQPLEPPDAPVIQAPGVTAEGVTLEWRASEQAEEYVIERAEGSDTDFVTLGRLATVLFLDRTARFGVTYRYRLRPFRVSASGWVEGPPSETISISPRDVFPPAPPQGLRAVRTADAVELSWRPNDEPDLAGYRVLRGGVALSPLIAGTSFSDRTVAAGTPYEYEITAVDASGNESRTGHLVTVPAVGSGID